MINLPFNPLFKNPLLQTILTGLIIYNRGIKSVTHKIPLSDGDFTTIEVSQPPDWDKGDGTIILVHGIAGSHKSNYMKRLARRFYNLGINVVRMNLRGCGSSRGISKRTYTSGCSGDLLKVLQYCEDLYGEDDKKIIIGFSLGANISLKLLGELGIIAENHIKGCIAVSPPVEMVDSVKKLNMEKNKIFADYLTNKMLKDFSYLSEIEELRNSGSNIDLNELFEILNIKNLNFKTPFEYHYYSSAKRVIKNIAIPTKILFSDDDPIISSSSLDDIDLPENMGVFKTKHGGHVGYLGFNIFKELYWMDNLLIDWSKEMLDN